MATTLLTIVLFGLIGYFIARFSKWGTSNRTKIILIILLVLAAIAHGLGFSGIDGFHMFHNDMLQGIFGGFLIGRMGGKTLPAA